MQNIKSFTQLKRELNARRFTRTHGGITTLDDWEARLASAKAQLAEHKVAYTEDETGIQFGSRYILKPKVYTNTHGTLTFNSTGLTFTADDGTVSHATVKASDVTLLPNGFTFSGFAKGHTITYTLLTD